MAQTADPCTLLVAADMHDPAGIMFVPVRFTGDVPIAFILFDPRIAAYFFCDSRRILLYGTGDLFKGIAAVQADFTFALRKLI